MATGPLAGFRSVRGTIQEWNSGSTTIGPIPHSMNERVLKSLSQSFTHRDNPHGHGSAKIAFQRDLDELFEADNAYRDKYDKDKGTPCLTRMITHLTCNCGGADINSTYRQCLVSMRNSTTYFTTLTYIVCQQGSSEVFGAAPAWGYSCRRAPCQVQQT